MQAVRLRDAEPALQRSAERAAATASMSERVEMNAAAEERKAKLRQEEVMWLGWVVSFCDCYLQTFLFAFAGLLVACSLL